MSITLKDIARLAGVSESTVSLALNNKSVVKEKTREQIKEIAAQLGYLPNAMAKSLARQRSGTIGLVVPDIENPYFGRLIHCVDEYLIKLHYNLIVATSNDRLSGERRIVENFVSERVEGVIIAPVNKTARDFDYIAKLQMNKIKYVFVTAYYPNLPASYVMTDLAKGACELVDYLIRLGHRKIYFLVGDQDTIPSMTRIQGYIKAFEQHGLPVDRSRFLNCSLLDFDHAYAVTQSLLRSGKDIDAIITINDIMALGSLRALSEQKIRIPGQISLAGYDNVIFSSVATIPITTVQQDITAMAVAAVDMLLEMPAADLQPVPLQSLLLPPQLIIRDSTGPRSFNGQAKGMMT